jgi:uncharacterized lipoprotein YbaY
MLPALSSATVAALLLAAVAAHGQTPDQPPATTPAVTGDVTYRQRIAVTAGARVEVMLADVLREQGG